MEKTLLGTVINTDDERLANYIERVLRVYGSSQPSVLEQEINRMAKILNIPLEEIYNG